MSKKAAAHRKQAAEHHTQAARHHGDGGKSSRSGKTRKGGAPCAHMPKSTARSKRKIEFAGPIGGFDAVGSSLIGPFNNVSTERAPASA